MQDARCRIIAMDAVNKITGTKHGNAMKIIMKIVLTGLILFFVSLQEGMGQENKKLDTITIQTSAVCGQCKDRIEQGLAFEKGVKSATLDEKTKKVKVTFNPAKTNLDTIRIAISKLGYDADEISADPKAYAKLPPCCKKDQTPH